MQSSPFPPPITLTIICPNIFLSTLLWNTLSLYSSLSVRDQVSHLYNISNSHTSSAIQKRAPPIITLIMVLLSTSRLQSGHSPQFGHNHLLSHHSNNTLPSSRLPSSSLPISIHTNVAGDIPILTSASNMSFSLDELGQKETET